MCIGQGDMAVTPMQMAVVIRPLPTAARCSGRGWWTASNRRTRRPAKRQRIFPSGLVRDELGVQPRSLKILRDAMLAETEDAKAPAARRVVPGLRICGKTGTAQVMDTHNRAGDQHNTWFASFAPYENPRYAVVVMVEKRHIPAARLARRSRTTFTRKF